jgi:hypothetical protein
VLIELGNVASRDQAIDDAPKVTTIHIPEFDDGSTHPDAVYENGRHPCADEFDTDGKLKPVGTLVTPGPPLGGYTHESGLTVAEFKDEYVTALMQRDGIFQLPDHELLLSVANAWPRHSREMPSWLEVTHHPDSPMPADKANDLTAFLHEYFQTDGAGRPKDLEQSHWTRFGGPGSGPQDGEVVLPDIKNLFLNDGRVQQATNYGGGQVGAVGTGTAASATTLTTNLTLTTNAWAGYRCYVYNGTNLVWGNVISNTNAAGASVVTVDRWYVAATPGGSAATTPASGYYFILADGGSVAAWFCGLTTTNITPAVADHSMTGEYVTASGGYIRKIAPYSQTSGVSPVTYTLTPVYTGNGSDTYPQTFYAVNFNTSMVVADTTLAQKFETSMNASATVAASGDQVTVTETMTGS